MMQQGKLVFDLLERGKDCLSILRIIPG
ncbi:hypothetical protein BVI434_180088 [Burkholderia vietnamiensis]|nr:hypothetical protein BVI434_180088 [Burkholderia vietnamiensis]